MIETPSDNVKLSFDQLQAIDVTQKRLSVLESEITNAQKILKGTKMENDRAVKENVYQNELLVTVTSQVEAKKKELEDLMANKAEAQSKLDVLNDEIKNKTTEQTKKDTEFTERENLLSLAEKANISNNESLARNLQKHIEDVKTFNSKVVKLKEVIKTF